MADLPTVSIIVPNYNGGKTIAATLQSLVDQQYPGLEIIVVDGGSTDNSVEIIRSFEPHLAWWVSEKDRGQSHAINKGFAQAHGDVVNWLCSDDLLLPGALQTIGTYFGEHPQVDILAGACRYMYLYKANPEHINRPTPELFALLPCINTVGQPSCFYRKRTIARPGPLREDLHFTMDLDLWCYFRDQGFRWAFMDAILTEAIEDGQNKTASGGRKIAVELEQLYRQYCHERVPLTFWWLRVHYPLRRIMAGKGPRAGRFIAHQLRRFATAILTPFYGLERIRTMENWYQFLEPGDRER